MLLALVLSSQAQTAPAPDATVVQPPEQARYAARTEIEFEAASLGGELARPSGMVVAEVRRLGFVSLIQVRQNFVDVSAHEAAALR